MGKNPLLQKYLKMYEKNPRSRVFAPLAEVYRKLGRFDDALVILKEGIRNHPDYIMGQVGLAACYHDCEQDQLAYSILRPLINKNRDNIRLQKLFAEVCIELKHEDEALEVYKYLLFLNPKDFNIQAKVKELENKQTFEFVEERGFTGEDRIASAPFDDLDDWVQVDFAENLQEDEDIEEEWVVQNGNEIAEKVEAELEKEDSSPTVLHENEEIEEPLEKEEENNEGEESVEREQTEIKEESKVNGFVTLTLVDLYVSQGYYAKAKEILRSFEGIDSEIIEKKLDEIEEKQKIIKNLKAPIVKAEGHEVLSTILDKKLGAVDAPKRPGPDNKVLSKKFNKFLAGIHSRAQKYNTTQKS